MEKHLRLRRYTAQLLKEIQVYRWRNPTGGASTQPSCWRKYRYIDGETPQAEEVHSPVAGGNTGI